MNNRSIRLLTLAAVVCIAGLTFVQGYWLKRAFDLGERQFHQNVQGVLLQVAESMRTYAQLPAFGQSPVVQLSSNYYAVMINSQIDPHLLEGLLTRELLRRNLQLDYEYGIYNCDSETLVYGNYVSLQQQQPLPSSSLPEWPQDTYYFSVHFPTKAAYLAQSLDIWLFSTAVILLVILFFIYTTFVVLKQKRFSEIQKDFINTITHEVKTPLTSILLSAEALQRQATPASAYTQLILQEATRIKNQVEQVLQSTQVDKPDLYLSPERLDMHSLIREVTDSLEMQLHQCQARLELDLHASAALIRGDRLQLTNLLFNLIDNSCKYSDAPPIIRISTENRQGKLCVQVSDQGQGIAREEQKKIFERFYRTAGAQQAKGFGLGLYYVKQVVKAHNGRIQLQSDPGLGSSFSIQFPQSFLAQ